MVSYWVFPTDVGEPAKTLVQGWFSDVQAYADDAWRETQSFIGQLEAAFGFDLGLPSFEFDFDPIAVEDHIPARPEYPEITVALPAVPTSPAYRAITLDAVDIPSMDVDLPVISYPTTPEQDFPADPGEIPAIRDPDLPTKPALTFPAEPALPAITLPGVPDVDYPLFTEPLPQLTVTAPSSTFTFNEERFDWVEDLRGLLYDTIQTIINNGGTALSGSVEEAIWTRMRSRLEDIKEEKYDRILNDMAQKGWTHPNGALEAALSKYHQEAARMDEDINNKIAEEMARMAWQEYQNALNQGIQLEQTLVGYANAINQRELEKQKAIQAFAIEVYNAQVSLFNANLARYQAAAQVYEVQTRAAALKLEAYKAEMEGRRISVEVQKVLVDIYQTKLDALKRYVELYVAEMEGVRLQVGVDEAKIRAYASKVQAYQAKIQGEVAKFQLHAAKIAGEELKVKVYAAQVEAFRAEMQGAEANARINVAQSEIQISSNNQLVEQYKADIEKYRADLTAKIEEARRIAELYGHQVEMYKGDLQHSSVQIDASIKSYEAMRQHEVNVAQLNLKQADINIQSVLEANKIQVEAIKAGAQVNAQLAASALSAVNATATVGYDDNRSTRYSRDQNISESWSEQHTYQH